MRRIFCSSDKDRQKLKGNKKKLSSQAYVKIDRRKAIKELVITLKQELKNEKGFIMHQDDADFIVDVLSNVGREKWRGLIDGYKKKIISGLEKYAFDVIKCENKTIFDANCWLRGVYEHHFDVEQASKETS